MPIDSLPSPSLLGLRYVHFCQKVCTKATGGDSDYYLELLLEQGSL